MKSNGRNDCVKWCSTNLNWCSLRGLISHLRLTEEWIEPKAVFVFFFNYLKRPTRIFLFISSPCNLPQACLFSMRLYSWVRNWIKWDNFHLWSTLKKFSLLSFPHEPRPKRVRTIETKLKLFSLLKKRNFMSKLQNILSQLALLTISDRNHKLDD